MRIVVHDYSGHPFQVQLSRWFAGQGHDVLHVYSADVETPHGSVSKKIGDPKTLTIEAITQGRALPKYDLFRRYVQELGYARRLVERVNRFRPDIVISCNPPPVVQWRLQSGCLQNSVPFVYWLQDIYSLAIEGYLRKRLPGLWWVPAKYFRRVEFGCLAKSDAVIVNSDDFSKILKKMAHVNSDVTVIENWAPIDELPDMDRNNAWSYHHGLNDKFVFLYSGTLGLKHNPEILSELARRFFHEPKVAVVVISQGLGRLFLEKTKRKENLTNLYLLDYQPFERVPEVLAAADVLVAILECEASRLSVPSKVLTYLTAGRPILAAMPLENLSARVINRANAGIVVAPNNIDKFVEESRKLFVSEMMRSELGRSGRLYAEAAFDIDVIGEQFMKVIDCTIRKKKKH